MFRFILSTTKRGINAKPLLSNLPTDLLDDLLGCKCKDKLYFDFLPGNRDFNPTNTFRWSCQNGRLDVAQWLVNTFDNIDVRAENDYAFRSSCYGGHLDVAQWLVNTFDNIDVRAPNDEAFRLSCSRGHLDVAQWLVDTFDNIDVNSQNDEAFRCSCFYGYLDVAQYICNITDDIHQNDDNLIKIALKNERYELVQYICNLSPYYELEYTEGHISSYRVIEYIDVKG